MCSAKKVFVLCEIFLKDFIRKYECGRTASTSGVYTHRKNERLGLAALAFILTCWEYPTPFENFSKLNVNLSVYFLILHLV